MSTRNLGLILVCLVAALGAQTPGSGCNLPHAIELHQAGNLEAALQEYRACLAVTPARVELQSNLGAVLAGLGRYREAIDVYREALKTAGPAVTPGLRFNLALAYYKSAQIPQAAAELQSLHESKPGDLNLALLLADCRLQTGAFRDAIDLLTPFENPASDQSAVDYVLGMAMIRAGRVAEGQVRVDRILRRGETAEARFLLGSARFTAGDYPGAVQELAKAIALNPGLPSLQSYYGQALLLTGDADGAAEAFRKELAANPNDFDANLRLASILAHRGKLAEARPLLERAAEVRPGSAEARDALANGFHFDTPPADPGIAPGSPAPPIGALDLRHPSKPVALIFGSYTCPKLRGSAEDLRRIAAEFGSRIDFRLVYIREAHAEGGPEEQWQSTINAREGIALPPARDLAEKQSHADLCVRKLSLPFAVVVDGMDAVAEKAYAAWPSRVYLVDRQGRVTFNTRLGELDFHPQDMERAIREMLAGRGPDGRRP